MNWLNLEMMSHFEKIFWIISIFSTIFFFLQIVTSLFGLELEVDFDQDGFFSIKSILAFLMLFGIVTAGIYGNGGTKFSALMGGLIAGALTLILVGSLIAWMASTSSDGTMKLKNAIGTTGIVYSTIPGHRSGYGLVQLTIQSSIREIEAETEGDKIETGVEVLIIYIENDKLIVSKKTN